MQSKSITPKDAQDLSNSWIDVAKYLLAIEATSGWSSTHKSFTEWLADTSKKLHLSESSLWRYYRAAKFYINLHKEFGTRKISAPEFVNLPIKVSPENLEILEKIERVAPKDVFFGLLERVINSKIKRDELRLNWVAYRKSLDGKTSRGNGVAKPKINLKDPRQQAHINEAQVLICLHSLGGSLIEPEHSSKYELIPNFKISPRQDGANIVCFDAMAIIQKDEDIQFHGIEIKSNNSRSQTYSSLTTQENYCDYVWIAFCSFDCDYGLKNIPEKYGILKLDKKQLEVIRKPLPNNPKHKLESALRALALALKV